MDQGKAHLVPGLGNGVKNAFFSVENTFAVIRHFHLQHQTGKI